VTAKGVAGPKRKSTAIGAWPFIAAVIMAHHVGSKAARDGFFLSNYGASALPLMIAGAAGFSLLAAWTSGRLMSRLNPRIVAAAGFTLSGGAQILEWMMLEARPGLASILIYLHMTGLGAVLLSAFWSMLSEEFDPREAKRSFGVIAAGGTTGGVLGGIAAERVVAGFGPTALVLALSLLHLVAAALLFGFRGSAKPRPQPQAGIRQTGTIRMLARSPYLMKLSLLVLIAGTGSALLDFVFKSQAAAVIGSGPNLLRFLALFHTGVALLTVLSQTFATRRSLESFRLGTTVGSLPAALAGGSLLAALAPALSVTVVARAIETMARNSLFRMGYEVCFTPVAPAEKRRFKATIDVGAERAGDALGAGIAMLCLWLAGSNFREAALLLAVAIGIVALFLTRFLDRGYVDALAASLMARKRQSAAETAPAFSVLADSGILTGMWSTAPSTPTAPPPPAAPHSASDPMVAVKALRSGDAALVRTALAGADVTQPVIASQVIPLLGRPEVADEAARRLQSAAGRIVGLLTDCLANPATDLAVRRKIPAVLAGEASERAVDGLVLGLEDSRFEVRRACATALSKVARTKAIGTATRGKILAAVDRELSFGKLIWERGLQDADSPEDRFDEFLEGRAQVGLEYVFVLLALLYDRAPLLVAFRSLHVEDRHLRGTALEYLESILPDATKKLLRQILGEQPPAQAPLDRRDVMRDLMDASPTVVLRVQDLQLPPAATQGPPGKR
jgi:AAA family ATP:ADP antiporter